MDSLNNLQGVQGSERIVVVDDDVANVELLRRVLRHGGYERVDAASDSESAIVRVTEAPTALLLLDLHLADGDGFDVITTLRERGEDLPILVVTGDVSPEVASHARELGADGVLVKPYELEELIASVRELLGRGAGGGGG